MISAQMARVIAAAEETRRAGAPRGSLEDRRARMRANAARMPDAAGVTVEPIHANGVPCEWSRPHGAQRTGVIVYLHGGGLAVGDLDTHRKMVGHLAAATGLAALSVGYRRPPEHPFPAALDDSLAVLDWLSAGGLGMSDVIVAGDSAGGGLALATAVARRDRSEQVPGGLVLLSPWLDMGTADDHTDDHLDDHTGDHTDDHPDDLSVEDPITTRDNLRELRDWYLGGADPSHPWASPLRADQHGMPPTLIHVGSRELLRADAERLQRRMLAAGVDVTCEVWDGMLHVWHFFAGVAPEADSALEGIAAWLQQRRTVRG